MILHLTSDLMATSGLKSVARQKGVTTKVVMSPKQLSFEQDEPVQLLVIDLQTNGLDVETFMGELRANYQGPVIAYAQHVHEELISSAQQAGIQNVITRGQFTRSMDQIVESVDATS